MKNKKCSKGIAYRLAEIVSITLILKSTAV